ncbi:MAG TPA: CPBP family glutamic-type intramembrane protease [Draconibacterium sp.]|nr:CPBP family glutamic-type intramembrane protease [Draconibacterium sp.]
MKLIKTFISFLKNPELSIPVSLSFKQSFLLLVKSIPLYILFVLFCALLFVPLAVFEIMPEFPNRQISDIKWLIVFAPVLEELFFRLPLRNSFKNAFVPIALCFYSATKSTIGIWFAIPFSTLIIIMPYFPNFINQKEEAINGLVRRHFGMFFYIISIVFGAAHMTNFEILTKAQILLTPIIIAYQILLGLYLGFVRVKYKWGIVYAILIHSLFNSIPVIIKFL